MSAGDDVTLGEVSRKLDDLRSEFRDMKTGFVPRGEYIEAQARNGQRMGNIENDVAEIKANLSFAIRIAWTGVVLPILVVIITAVVLASLGIKK